MRHLQKLRPRELLCGVEEAEEELPPGRHLRVLPVCSALLILQLTFLPCPVLRQPQLAVQPFMLCELLTGSENSCSAAIWNLQEPLA